MTPQERQLVDDLFDRLSKVEGAPRDPDALAAIAQGLRRAPNALYALVQTVLLQDEALKRAHSRIQELEGENQPQPSGGFLDSVRETIFGQAPARGSVPNVRPPELPGRPTWNSGQVMQQAQGPGQYGQGSHGQQPQGGQQAIGGGGSFLGTAAAAAVGMVGGSLLMNSLGSMMGGGNRHSFGDAANAGDGGAGHRGSVEDRRPWGDQSGGDLAKEAGINDIGSSGRQASYDDNSSRSGLFGSDDDHDDMDMDSDDYGDNGGGDSE